ncbi:MAG: hypothetical protein KDA32_13375 [Phycisphaerales bacterium]|nr:hypothetical protein [Phycisphaerales bacterium]
MIPEPDQYGPYVWALICEPRLPALHEPRPNRAVADLLNGDAARLFGITPTCDKAAMRLCVAALWMYHDCLDEAHDIVQRDDSRIAALLHGMIHTRDGDYANARLWRRRAGRFPFFGRLSEAACEVAWDLPGIDTARPLGFGEGWDGERFVDICRDSLHSDEPDQVTCRQAMLLEWRLAFDYCYRQATGLI